MEVIMEDVLREIIASILYRDPASLVNAFYNLGYNTEIYRQLVEEIEAEEGIQSDIRGYYPEIVR